MERIEETSTARRLPELLLYRDEIDAIYSYLSQECDKPVTIEVAGYRLDSPAEIADLKLEGAKSIALVCQAPYVAIEIGAKGGRIYVGDGSSRGKGIAAHAEQILLPAKALIAKMPWWWGLPVGALFYAATSALRAGEHMSFLAWIALVLTSFLIMLVASRRVGVVFRYRVDSPGFWKRNSDKLLLLMIGAAIGALVTLLTG